MSQRLEAILDLVGDALIRGDIVGMAGLADELDSLSAAISSLDRPTAERLRRRAQRNERLLSAALSGVRAARNRVAEIKSAPQLTTYTSGGRREVLPLPSALAARRV